MARQWTLAERARQAELIQNWKPWKESTGAKSAEGKATTSRNAYKGGQRQWLRNLCALLREQQLTLKTCLDSSD